VASPAEPDVVSSEVSQEPVAKPDEQPSTGTASRVTVALVVAIVLLVAVAATESWYLWLRDDPVVSSARPVVSSDVATASAVDSAAKALKEIVATSWKDYAQQTEDATKLMTSAFAADYRTTAEAIQDDVVAGKTEVKVEITHQGVVRASSEQVQALVFLTQYVTHRGKHLTLTPYRALVTVVNTEQGWLVSGIDTQ
jgi:Mce-associated membrane protein